MVCASDLAVGGWICAHNCPEVLWLITHWGGWHKLLLAAGAHVNCGGCAGIDWEMRVKSVLPDPWLLVPTHTLGETGPLGSSNVHCLWRQNC